MKTMIPAKRFLLLSIMSMLLLAGMALSVQAQRPAGEYRPNPNATPIPTPAPIAQPDFQPLYSVNGKIRWKKIYGVVPVSASVENSIENRCISFYVAALDPSSNQPLRGDHSQMWKADDEGEYHVCRYALKLPQNRKVRVIASMGGDGLLPDRDPNPLFWNTPWVGSTDQRIRERPPQGWTRSFTGSRYVTLNNTKQRDSVDFEMIYVPPLSNDPK